MKNQCIKLLDRWAERRSAKCGVSKEAILAEFPDPSTWSERYQIYLLRYLQKEVGSVQ